MNIIGIIFFNVAGVTINPTEVIQLLGVNIEKCFMVGYLGSSVYHVSSGFQMLVLYQILDTVCKRM